jgi:hypothetical protein
MSDTASPADELRAAADKLRALITDLRDCRGPWYVVNRKQRPYPQRIDNIGVPYVVASTTTDPSHPPTIADYIAAMHPGVGRAVADWLTAAADEAETIGTDPEALAVAQAILGQHAPDDASVRMPCGCDLEGGDCTDKAAPDTGLREEYAALFRCPPGETLLGDEPPGTIADAILTVRDHAMAELRADCQQLSDQADEWCARAETAEAALTRVRDVATVATANPAAGLSDYRIGRHDLAQTILTTLGQTGQEQPEPTEES